jgi:hypothetical protein
VLVTDAYVKGMKGIDYETVFKAMVLTARSATRAAYNPAEWRHPRRTRCADPG